MLLSFFTSPKTCEAGLDEAGRGCLAGPVVAGAVVLPKDYKSEVLDDSKKITEKKRDFLRIEIEREAISYGVGFVWQEEIDEINILNASFLAMHRAVDLLEVTPELLLVDGNRFNTYKAIPHECIIKGDGKYLSIAAASILAKTYRDEYMTNLSEKFPEYGWDSNAGYPTKKHRAAIKEFGSTEHHRHSFTLLPRQIDLFT